jgi:hypothetical protein
MSSPLRLTIKISEAKLNYSVAKIGGMNPYCSIVTKNFTKSTCICSDGNLTPKWNEIMTFEVQD